MMRTVPQSCRAALAVAACALPGLLVTTPAAAQDEPAPVVEVGADVSISPHGEGWSAVGPRLTLNLDSRTSLEVSFALERDRGRFSHVNYFFVHARRTLRAFDRGALYGSVGAAQSTRVYGDDVYRRQTPVLVEPDRSWGPSVGLGLETRLTAWLGLRAETQYVLSQEPILRFSGGATVPIGRYPDEFDRDRAADEPVTGPFAAVRIGQTVWVTTAAGVESTGEVSARTSDALTLRQPSGRTTIARTEVRAIETTDGLLNGVVIGALGGAAGGGVLGGLGGQVWCEGTTSCVFVSALLLGGLGAGIGALSGAVVDSFRDGRVSVFEATGAPAAARVVVGPMASRGRVGATASVTW